MDRGNGDKESESDEFGGLLKKCTALYDITICSACNLPVPKHRCRCGDTEESACHCIDEDFLQPEDLEYCECPDNFEVKIVQMQLCQCGGTKCICGKGLHCPEVDDWEKLSKKRESVEEPLAVLQPQHPLLQKFQGALHAFLEQENDRLMVEIRDKEDQLKERKKSYKDYVSKKLYLFERDVNDQRQSIVEIERKLEETTLIRKEKDGYKEENIKRHKTILGNEVEQKNKEREIQEELTALNALIKQFLEWQKDTESDLTISQRISEKMVKEKKQHAEEKKKLDMLIYHLTTRIWHLDSQIGVVREQIAIKEEEANALQEKVAHGTADLNAINIEKKRLMQVWQSIIILIGQRDKLYMSVNDDYKNLQESYRTLEADYESLKKTTKEEMSKNQTLMMAKDRNNYDISVEKKSVKTELQKQKYLDDKMMEYNMATEITAKDLETACFESGKMKDKDLHIKKTRLNILKVNIENEIIATMEDRLTSDKAVESMISSIRKLKETTRHQELAIVMTENQSAKLLLQIEKMRIRLARCGLLLHEEQDLIAESEQKVKFVEQEQRNIRTQLVSKQRELDVVNTKIAQFVEKYGVDMSPMERKIHETEKQLQVLKTKAEDMQQQWLRIQGHCVNLSSQYHEQIDNINLIQKQIQIMEQKNLKFNTDIEAMKHEHNCIQRSLEELQTKLQTLSRKRYDDKISLEQAELTQNCLAGEYLAQLKEAEIEIINLEESISNLEKEKQALSEELNMKQKEVLVWQKKGITAVEAKASADKAKSKVGDIGKMRAEIHRMHVRQSQLKRISQKLSSDLMLCIHRREAHAMKSRAQAALKVKPKLKLFSTDKQIRRHLSEFSKEISRDQREIEKLLEEQSTLLKQLEEKRQLLDILEKHLSSIEKDLEDKTIEKNWNFEKIVRNQRYGKAFLSLAEGRTKIHGEKSELCILADQKKLQETTENLVDIVKDLADNMPEAKYKLLRIMNTLSVEIAVL